MATHEVTHVATPTLSGTTVDSVKFPLGARGRLYVANLSEVEMAARWGHGVDANDVGMPSIDGNDCYPIPAGRGRYLTDNPIHPEPDKRLIVRVISEGGGRVSVELR